MMQASMCSARNILDIKNINKLKSEGNKMCTLNIFLFGLIFLATGTHVKRKERAGSQSLSANPLHRQSLFCKSPN